MSYRKNTWEAAEIVSKLDAALCEKAVELLATVRTRGGRLFILGVGGSAANASMRQRFPKDRRHGMLRAYR